MYNVTMYVRLKSDTYVFLKRQQEKERENPFVAVNIPPPPLLYPHNLSNTQHSATMNTLKPPEGSRQHFITPLKQTLPQERKP